MASRTPTGASQRLLTMKFMQRAAAASSPTSPTAPSDDDHSSKRRKTAGRSSLGAPETPAYVVDQGATRAALQEEERRHEAAVARQAEKLGDSHWVLDTTKLPRTNQQAGTPLNIVRVGFSQIDRRGDREEQAEEFLQEDVPKFQSYGPMKKAGTEKKEKDSDSDSGSDDSNSSDSGESSSEDSSDEDGSHDQPARASYGSQRRPEISSRQSEERERAKKLASKRREKEVKLNQLTSISSAGSYGSRGANSDRRR